MGKGINSDGIMELLKMRHPVIENSMKRHTITFTYRKWMLAIILTGMLALLMPEQGMAQQSQLTGIVKDSADGHPISIAMVYIINSEFGTFSKNDGSFSMATPRIYGDSVRLRVSADGYIVKELSFPKGNMTIPLQVQLQRIPTTFDFSSLGRSGCYLGKKPNWWQRLKRKLM